MDTKVGRLIKEGSVDEFLAYETVNGFPFPKFYSKENMDKLESWRMTSGRFPILKMLLARTRINPDKKYGILVRGCEERGLRELFKWNQLALDKVVILGQACSQKLADYCKCHKPYPDQLDYGEPSTGIETSRILTDLELMERDIRQDWWLGHFNRCIKCYGCRDVCPVCFCSECSLENELIAPEQSLPPDTSFHLVRAVHMAGRCIDCGLCEEVCPARIPLRSLYKQAGRLVEKIFGYVPGMDSDRSPFTFLGEEIMLPEAPK